MWSSSTCRIGLQSLVLAALFVADGAHGGSCREASLCCSGRDSACVVQKVPPSGAITTDLNVKPCYCDHACLKLRDCCPDFKSYCGV
ncbi:conserved hypothetical protein [Culex quinquefasciatus]|uniref:SMB domain-containing protein n=2 Tax=Culex pipiens complex TaxID=518105 RepID=B0W0N1_CULQU|nr:conserved hypothetical protein [Culex quinquefasciatus]|eukprot:XP_001842265.1 conserved hypothetical protein [Culex quinquefasciatus]